MKRRSNYIAVQSKFIPSFGDGPDGLAILTSLLSNYYKLTQEQIDEILTDGATAEDAIKKINVHDAARTKKQYDAIEKQKYQEAAKKVKGEVLTQAETDLKTAYGVESDLTGKELVEFIVAEKLKESANTEEAIKGSPTYKALEKRLTTELAQAKKDGELKLTELAATHKKENEFALVAEFANTQLDGLNPVLATNAEVAATHRKNFVNDLKNAYEWAIEGDGPDIKYIAMKDGQPATDETGNVIEAGTIIKNVASRHFEFAANGGGENADNKGKPGGGPKPTNGNYPKGITKPKTQAELTVIMNNKTITLADRRIVVDTFRAENEGAKK